MSNSNILNYPCIVFHGVVRKEDFMGLFSYGIFQSMVYLHENALPFDYVLVLSSRNFFKKVVNIDDLRRIEARQQNTRMSNSKLIRWKGEKFYEFSVDKEKEWWWPNFLRTRFASRYECFAAGVHEGLLLNYETVKSLIEKLKKQHDIFRENLPMEEFVIQTVCRNENLSFTQLSEHDYYVLKEAPLMKVDRC